MAVKTFGACDLSRLAVTDWRLRRRHLCFWALMTATRLMQNYGDIEDVPISQKIITISSESRLEVGIISIANPICQSRETIKRVFRTTESTNSMRRACFAKETRGTRVNAASRIGCATHNTPERGGLPNPGERAPISPRLNDLRFDAPILRFGCFKHQSNGRISH